MDNPVRPAGMVTTHRSSVSSGRRSVVDHDRPDDLEGHFEGSLVSGADPSPAEYERWALEMLAVEAGDVADVKDAMRKIIASAPEGADVAFLLSRALARAGDRALAAEAPQPLSWNLGDGPSMWWVAAAAPFVVASAMFGWLGNLALQTPKDGGDPAGLAAISMFVISTGSLVAALIGIETLLLLRCQAQGLVALPSNLVCPPGWYADPWDQGTSRWWNGSHWTGRLRV